MLFLHLLLAFLWWEGYLTHCIHCFEKIFSEAHVFLGQVCVSKIYKSNKFGPFRILRKIYLLVRKPTFTFSLVYKVKHIIAFQFFLVFSSYKRFKTRKERTHFFNSVYQTTLNNIFFRFGTKNS